MNLYVVDSSFVLSFLFPDELTKNVKDFFKEFIDKRTELIAPTILPYEVANGLKSATRRKRLSEDEASKLIERFQKLHIPLASIDMSAVLAYAIEKNLSVYDASYAWLARRYNCELMTHDKLLQKALE